MKPMPPPTPRLITLLAYLLYNGLPALSLGIFSYVRLHSSKHSPLYTTHVSKMEHFSAHCIHILSVLSVTHNFTVVDAFPLPLPLELFFILLFLFLILLTFPLHVTSIYLWLIPVLCLSLFILIFSFFLDFLFHVVFPSYPAFPLHLFFFLFPSS